ncbi:MAG: HEAT repeat domain-containing protein [Planctomycetota bacterium]|jgi:hypothetical protein
MKKLIVLITVSSIFCTGYGISKADAADIISGEPWKQLAGAPGEIGAIGDVVKQWFAAYKANDPARGKTAYIPGKRNVVGRDFEQLRKLLETAKGWEYQPMAIMAGESEAKAVSGPMEITGPGTGNAAVLIVHLKKDEGKWQILYWSADALRLMPDFYSQFRRKHPGALIWFDETIDDWLKPVDETGVDIDIEELLSVSEAKPEDSPAQKLRESRGEQAKFESYFPDSTPGGRILDSWWKTKDKEAYSAEEILTIIRNGLRRTKGGEPRRRKQPYIRWVGQQYIRGSGPKNKKAVELVYHASFDSDLTDISVYFGLSVAGDQQSKMVLERLVDLCMSDIYTKRILWGTRGKHNKMTPYLKPYFNNADEQIRERAIMLEKVFRGEVNYEQWEAEQFKKQRQEQYSNKLPTIRTVLLKGNSRQRRDVFGLITRAGLGVLFDDSFVEAFKACLKDKDPVVREMALGFGSDLLCRTEEQERQISALMSSLAKDSDSIVRKQVAVFVGSCWIWNTDQRRSDAIKTALLLSKDTNHEVRNAAVYYGLSVVADMDDDIIRRLIELAVDPDSQADFGRILWGLGKGADKEKVREQLQPLVGLTNKKGELARKIYFEIFADELEAGTVVF